MSLTKHLKSYFLRGLAVLLPTILTVWIFVWAFIFIQKSISVHINRGLVRVMVLAAGDRMSVSDERVESYLLANKPELRSDRGELAIHMRRPEVRRRALVEQLEQTWVHGPGAIAGFILAVVGVCVVGAILASVVGRALWRTVDRFIMNAPILRRVYPYIKQVTDFLLTQEEEQGRLFSRVVAVEYPRKGVWSIGLATGAGLKKVNDSVQKEFLTVLIPNSPTPLTGYVVLVPKEQTLALDISIEEAFRFIITAGVVAPVGQGVNSLPGSGEPLNIDAP